MELTATKSGGADPPKKVRVWHKEWWKQFATATNFLSYTPREWGIYHFSSLNTQLWNVLMVTVGYLSTKISLVAVKAFLAKMFGFIGALLAMFTS